jgi:hypothetical protein
MREVLPGGRDVVSLEILLGGEQRALAHHGSVGGSLGPDQAEDARHDDEPGDGDADR